MDNKVHRQSHPVQKLDDSLGGDAIGLSEELQRQKAIRAKKKQVQFQQELQHSFESSMAQSLMNQNQRRSRGGIYQRSSRKQGADVSMTESDQSFAGLSRQDAESKSKLDASMISSTSQARQRRHDKPPELIFDDDPVDEIKEEQKNKNNGVLSQARRDTANIEADLDADVHEVPISLPGVQLSLHKARSQLPKADLAASKDLSSIRGSVCIRKGDLNNISIDRLNPNLASVNGTSINKLTMRLPIYQILQAQVLERYQRQGQSKKDEQALVALKLSKPPKNADPKSLYKIAMDNQANPRAGAKYLQDPNKTVVKTLGAEPFAYKIELFDEDWATSKERSINEQVFDQLNLEQSIWDCCQNGKNLTFFSVEDAGKKNGLSAMFNGKSRQLAPDEPQTESERRPGTIRMTVESIFAHIFQNRGSEFVMRFSYVEINNEMVYDLLQDGKQISAPDEVSEENCLNIEQTMQMKARGDANRLQNLLGGNRQENDFVQESTLVLKFTIENLARDRVTDYEMMLNEEDLDAIKVCKSQIVFVDLPEFFKKGNKQMEIQHLKQRRPHGQEPSLFVIDRFIKANVEQRINDAKEKKTGESDLEMKPAVNSRHPNDRDRGLAGQLKALEKYQIANLLSSQLQNGNSKMVFMFSLSPEQRDGDMGMLVQMATEAALVCQTSVQMNEIGAEESQLIRLKDEIEQKEGQVTSIEFQIKQSQEQQVRSGSVNFKNRRSQLQRDGDHAEPQRKSSAMATKTQEEMDLQHKQVQKFRIINRISTLNKQILRQDGVAKFMQQFEVNQCTRRISKILKGNDKNDKMDSVNTLRMSTYVDRMSRRVASAKAFLDEDKAGVGHLNSSDTRASGRLDFQQQLSQKEVQEKIAQFVRLSVKAVNNQMDVSGFQQRVRDSVKQTIRMSVAAKQKMSLRAEENLQKLNMELARKAHVLSGKKDARMYEKLKEVRMTNANKDKDLLEKVKEEDIEVHEGNNSLFDQNLTMQDDILEFGQAQAASPAPVKVEVAEDKAEPITAVDHDSSFLADHLKDISRHASEVGLDMQQADDTLFYGDDLLNDTNLDDYIHQNLENLQNLEVENIRLDGDVLDLDLNLKIDIPDYLADITQLSLSQQLVIPSKEPAQQDAAGQGPTKARKFLVNPDGTVQSTRIDKQINDLSNKLASTALQAQERVKYQDLENDISLQGIYKSPSLYSSKQTLDNKADDKLLLEDGTDSPSDEDDDLLDSEEESFNISLKDSQINDSLMAHRNQLDRNDDAQPAGEQPSGEEDDGNMGVRDFLAMQRQNYGKNAFRGTIINEAAEEEEEDSFEIKKEIKKKKDFENYSSKLESIQQKVDQYTTKQKQKMRQSIKQLNEIRQRASLLHQKKALEQQARASAVRRSEKIEDSKPPRDLAESAQKQLYGRKESEKIADKFLNPSFHDEDEQELDHNLAQLDSGPALDDSSFDLAALRGTDGGVLKNEFDLSLINDADLLAEMAALESQAKNTMEDLIKEQEDFERQAQREMRQTVKQIRASIKSSIRQSRATITKRRTQRETMKKLQADASVLGSKKGGAKGGGLTNEKCGNCDNYLETIEQYEKEIDDLQKEVATLRKMGGL